MGCFCERSRMALKVDLSGLSLNQGWVVKKKNYI